MTYLTAENAMTLSVLEGHFLAIASLYKCDFSNCVTSRGSSASAELLVFKATKRDSLPNITIISFSLIGHVSLLMGAYIKSFFE